MSHGLDWVLRRASTQGGMGSDVVTSRGIDWVLRSANVLGSKKLEKLQGQRIESPSGESTVRKAKLNEER